MIIKIFFFVLLVSLTTCGFEPIYSKKSNLNISINSFELKGEKKLNRKIISILNLKKSNNKASVLKLELESSKKIDIVSRDKTGIASIYRTTITISVSLREEDKLIKQKTFSSNFTYNNMSNKFDLTKYQNNIESDLINKLTDQILIFLN
tara:strand:+ start:40 stop:489 length:450 start_codon:yes stop_codon:yes gene_type:complete